MNKNTKYLFIALALFVVGSAGIVYWKTRPALEPTAGATVIFETQGGTGQSTYRAGDLLYGDGVNSLGKLATGSANQVLKMSGGLPVWGSDLTGGGASTLEVRTFPGGTSVSPTATLSFDNGHFNLTASGSTDATLKLDWTNGPASRSQANTWAQLQTFTLGASFTTSFESLSYGSASYYTTSSNGLVTAPSYRLAGGAGVYLANTGTLGLTNGVSGLSWNGTGFYPNTDVVRTLGLAGTNRWLGLFAMNASISTSFEALGTASISSTFTVNGTGSHSFGGTLSGLTDNTFKIGSLTNRLKELVSYIVRVGTKLIVPARTASNVNESGAVGVNTATGSFNFNDGTAERVLPAEKCFSVLVRTPTAKTQLNVKRFRNPFTITSVSINASGSNAAGWNFYHGQPGTVTTPLFAVNKSASTSAYPTYTVFNDATLTDGEDIDVAVTSASAVLNHFTPTVCGYYDAP